MGAPSHLLFCYPSSASGHRVGHNDAHQCLCILLLALFSLCSSELESVPFKDPSIPSLTQHPSTPGSEGQDSRLKAFPSVGSTTTPGRGRGGVSKSNSSSPLACFLAETGITREGSDLVNGSGAWGFEPTHRGLGTVGNLDQVGGPQGVGISPTPSFFETIK